MVLIWSRRRVARNAILLASLLAISASSGSRADAQCQLLLAPSKFDPPESGLPSYFRFQPGKGALSAGGTGANARLAVRYNYGFIVYGLSNPGAPARTSIEDLLADDGYPKNGDGQSRVGPLTLSADGTRALETWTDVAAYGTVALSRSSSAFIPGGDFIPRGSQVTALATMKIGSRYLGFSFVGAGVYAADITSYTNNVGSGVKNGISSELIANSALDTAVGLAGVESSGRSYVVAWSTTKVAVIDVTNPGSPGAGLTANFTTSIFTASQLGISAPNSISAVAAASHPTDGSLHILVEGGKYSGPDFVSAGVTLNKVPASGGLERIGGPYQPPVGARYAQSQILLLPFETELVAFFLERTDSGPLKLHAHSSGDFATNLADSLSDFTQPLAVLSMAGLRASGGNVFLYMMAASGTYVASLNCTTAPTPVPATALLSVEKVPYSGGATTPVTDGGSVFIGDQLRIKPAFLPADSVQPLLDWRLDYDFHDGNTLDSNATTFRLKEPDLHVTAGGSFPTQATLIGPCDPAQVPQGGSAPVPSSGTGCWESVTTNGTWTVPGTPDFSALAPVEKELTIGFEAQNALNDGSSSLAKHRISWKVPKQLLKSSSILSGGTLEDFSEGSPLTTGVRWYFSQSPDAEPGFNVLKLEAGCTGLTCLPSFVQTGQTSPGLQRPGTYRYWVSVPYRGGFRTAECPDLQADLVTCLGDLAKTVKVTDVVLSLTAPTQVYVGTSSITLTSTSQKAGSVAACPAAPGFTYNICEVSGGSCAEGTFVSTGLSAPAAFPGTISIPTPPVGTWGVRIKYSYTTNGSCTSPTEAQWPAEGGWSPLTVSQAAPSISLRNSGDTADLFYGYGTWELATGETARLYALVNGVRDMNPPGGLAWSRRLKNTTQETSLGTTQGASFSISTGGEYEVILRGYGADVFATVGVAAPPVNNPPSASSISASSYSPAVNQVVSFSCNATQGTYPITSYDWVLDYSAGVTRTTTSASTTSAYGSSGTKTFRCSARDSNGQSSNTVQGSLTVGGSGGGGGSGGPPIVTSVTASTSTPTVGQTVSFSCNATQGGAPITSYDWVLDSGVTRVTASSSTTYAYATSGSKSFACSANDSAGNSSSTVTNVLTVFPEAGPSFTVVDADSLTALASVNGVWQALAGQRLKFTASGTTGAFSWNFGDGETSLEASPVKTYGPAVDATFVVTLTNGGDSKQSSILVKGSTGAPLTGNFTYKYADGTSVSRSAVQPNKAIVFTGVDQATLYTWDFGDGSALATGSPKEYAFTRGGSFTVKVTVARDGVPGTVTTPSPLAFTVLAPPDPLLWVAAGMAYLDGGNGERWQSDLSIYNPGSQTATVSLGFVPGEGWAGATNVLWIPRSLVAGETLSYTNILSSFFKLSKGAWGVVLVNAESMAVAPIIVSRTYNAASAEQTGTFGLSVPAMSVAAGVRPQSAAASNFLADLRHDASFRTNLTVANLKAETAEVEVIFRDAAGNVVGSPAKITVEGRGVKQLGSVLSAAPATGDAPSGGAGWSSPISHFSAEVKLKRGSGVYPYATVIDQGTGDSIVVAPTARPSATYRLPGIVRLMGQSGKYWVSDVAVLNPSAKTRKVRVTYSYVRSGTSLRIDAAQTVTLNPNQLLVGVDFVRTWLGLAENDPSGYASSYVDIAPAPDDPAPTEPLVVVGKTYIPSGNGSVGLQVDPYVLEDGMSQQGSRRRLVLSGLEANSRSRTNVALFLTPGSTGSLQVDVHVLDSFGRESKKIAFVGLNDANPFVQLDSAVLFANLSTDESSRATVVIDTPRGTGYLGAYATVIDNLSEDATFVAGQPAP